MYNFSFEVYKYTSKLFEFVYGLKTSQICFHKKLLYKIFLRKLVVTAYSKYTRTKWKSLELCGFYVYAKGFLYQMFKQFQGN